LADVLAVSFEADESLAVIVSSAATDATLSSQHWLWQQTYRHC